MDILQHIIDILKIEMGLKSQQILIYNQKWDIPSDFNLFIYVSLISSVFFGSKKEYMQISSPVEELKESISSNKLDLIGIDILSRGVEALYHKEDIILALNSTYSQQKQEKYSFKISNLPISFKDLSFLEATAILYRFNYSFNVFSATKKEKLVDYFNVFDYDLITNK